MAGLGRATRAEVRLCCALSCRGGGRFARATHTNSMSGLGNFAARTWHARRVSPEESPPAASGWRDATALITQFILAGRETSEVLDEVVRSVRQLAGAAQALVSFTDDSGHDLVEVESISGGSTMLGSQVPTGSNLLVAQLGEDQGHAMKLTVAPVGDRFDAEVVEQFLWFTDQVRIAIALGSSRRTAEQLLILEDRDRIARDLHDVVIQRLFGAGMQLDSVQLSLAESSEAKAKIDNVLVELDRTIKDIRATIFALRSGKSDSSQTLNQRLGSLVEELGAALELEINYMFRGLEQQEVAEPLAQDVLAVVREALTNVAKHASGDRAEVVIRVDEEEIVLTVVSDGQMDPQLARASSEELAATGHSGLINMRSRAQTYSGSSFLSELPGEPERVRLTWNASMLVRPAQ